MDLPVYLQFFHPCVPHGPEPSQGRGRKDADHGSRTCPSTLFHFLHTQVTSRDAASEIQAEPFTNLTVRHRVLFRRAWQKGILNFIGGSVWDKNTRNERRIISLRYIKIRKSSGSPPLEALCSDNARGIAPRPVPTTSATVSQKINVVLLCTNVPGTRFVSVSRPKPPPRRGFGGGSSLHTRPVAASNGGRI